MEEVRPEEQRAIYDARLDEIRAEARRRQLEEATEPTLGETAIHNTAAWAAVNQAS
jgi:hypothetical protein